MHTEIVVRKDNRCQLSETFAVISSIVANNNASLGPFSLFWILFLDVLTQSLGGSRE